MFAKDAHATETIKHDSTQTKIEAPVRVTHAEQDGVASYTEQAEASLAQDHERAQVISRIDSLVSVASEKTQDPQEFFRMVDEVAMNLDMLSDAAIKDIIEEGDVESVREMASKLDMFVATIHKVQKENKHTGIVTKEEMTVKTLEVRVSQIQKMLKGNK